MQLQRGNSHESAVIMDRIRTDRRGTQGCGNDSSAEESEYHVVDDQEKMVHVHILPARPIDGEREYADRDLPRSSSAQSLSSLSTGNFHKGPRCPPRESSHSTGPAINRALKPGRRKVRSDKTPTPAQPGQQRPNRCPPSPPAFSLELANRLPGLSLQEACRSDGKKKTTKRAELGSQNSAQQRQRAESVSGPHTTHRRSLDLESHDIEKRSQLNLERVPSRRQNHEWPQTKEDFNQLDFVPKEKPKQTYCEEDWYIGDCTRADAEHALHLVNKDGAFLVRDCSINTNSEPLVLVVYHEKKVYNVKIRFIVNTRKYALGRSSDAFDSVAEIIRFHSIFPITLISGRNLPGSKFPENCVLTCAVTRRDVDQLLQ
ncbi:cytokine-dependent hematopoietic cell linker isoform X2 [Betta splendens]|uniref:Cytokine-dependent hematopoietic cell linker isoform X2 n=1 Tax=Betta splendens TaxID=158456 RepID=A0A6P7NV81_BETSP|nr:cytokine-dependent hematopoietic cell linker isoform X2 [Betta splendens]